MRIGIGLPNTLPGTTGTRMLEWAQRAEERGFATLATLDRVVYPNYESLIALAAVAGATSRITLLTNVLLAPAYPPVWLAKATASVDQLSAGRLTLGLAPGGRPDDFAAMGRNFSTRGRDFDATLELLHRAWRGEPVAGSDTAVGPVPVRDNRIPVLVGGTSEQTLRRVVEWGAGWVGGGSTPDQARGFTARVRTAWKESGREGEPRLGVLNYFSLGDEAVADSRAYLKHYYAWFGADIAEMIAGGAHRSPTTIRDAVHAFEDAGINEFYLDPTVSSLDQVDRLADAVL